MTVLWVWGFEIILCAQDDGGGASPATRYEGTETALLGGLLFLYVQVQFVELVLGDGAGGLGH